MRNLPLKEKSGPCCTSDGGKWRFSEDRRVYCELIVEGLGRMESPLTDSVASFLITIG